MHGAVEKSEGDVTPASTPPAPCLTGYEGLTFLARGGFGLIYKAIDRSTGATVAIKVARDDRPDARRRLAEELHVLTEIGPPHVPAVLGRGDTTSGSPYVVLEYLGDASLAGRLMDGMAPLPLGEALDLAIAIVRALAAVHDRGYVHRDLKPENIFVAGAGPASPATGLHARLIDFGLVVGSEEAAGAPQDVRHSPARDISGERAVVGTIDYMSPEQCEGLADIDIRTDIYAMGVILHELITGRSPFWGPRAVVREKHLSHRPPRLSAADPELWIPPALEDIASGCLAKDRKDRFGSARDLLAALEAVRGLAEAPEIPPVPSSRMFSRQGGEARKLTCGVVFFETGAAPAAVQARLRAVGGQIAHGAGGRYAAVFGQEASLNPAERALAAARQLVRGGVCARARVDLATVTAQTRRDGGVRFLNPALAQPDHYPPAGGPEIEITPAAAEVLPDCRELEDDMPPSSMGGSRPGAPGSLLGREEILATLMESARTTARGGPSAVVTVTGEAGTGKSHLFRELSSRLAALEPAVQVLALRAREPALGDVDPTLTELVRWGVSARAPGEGEIARSEVLAAVLAQGSAGARDGRQSPSRTGAVRGLGAAPGALRSALTADTGEALRRRAMGRPLLVLLDDAHAAGDIALEALEYATQGDAGGPPARQPPPGVWVCAIGRPALVQDHPAWGERAGRRESFTIGPLDPASAEQLCRRLLLPVESVPGPAVEMLVARAEATPLLLVELVRGLHREGIVRRSPKGESYYLATDELDRLPDLPLVEWLTHQEIEGLAPALRDHARLIALLGDDTTEAEILGVVSAIDELGGGAELPLDAGVATRRLLGTGMILREREGRLRYRHALVRQVLARDTPEGLRRLVHEAAATFYRRARALPEHRRLSQLAEHTAEAGLAAEAARTFLALAERARAWHSYLEAERLYSRALEQPGIAGDDSAVALRGRGLMRYRLARYHDALADFAEARALADERGDTMTSADIQLDEAIVLDWMRDFATSELRVQEAERRATAEATPLFRARLLLAQGRTAHRFDRNEEAATLLYQAVSAAEPLGDDAYETRVIALLMLGFILALPSIGRPEDAHQALKQLIALCEAHGDKLHLGGALSNRALLWGGAGNRQRMIEDAERMLAISRELGQASLELMGEVNLGEYLLLMDDPGAAAPHIARARALDLRITGVPGLPLIVLLEARFRLYMGDLDAAATLVRDLRESQAAARTRGEADRLMVPSEDVLCRAIELSLTDAGAGEWDALEARSEECSVGQERIEVIETRATALLRANRAPEARAHLARALDLAARIPNAMRGRLQRRMDEIERSTSSGPS